MLTSYDYPLLIEAGFKQGMTDTLLWKTDKDGNQWQAVVHVKNIDFIEHSPDLSVRQASRPLTPEEFTKRFT